MFVSAPAFLILLLSLFVHGADNEPHDPSQTVVGSPAGGDSHEKHAPASNRPTSSRQTLDPSSLEPITIPVPIQKGKKGWANPCVVPIGSRRYNAHNLVIIGRKGYKTKEKTIVVIPNKQDKPEGDKAESGHLILLDKGIHIQITNSWVISFPVNKGRVVTKKQRVEVEVHCAALLEKSNGIRSQHSSFMAACFRANVWLVGQSDLVDVGCTQAKGSQSKKACDS